MSNKMKKRTKKYTGNKAEIRMNSAERGLGKILSVLSRGLDVKCDKEAIESSMTKLYPVTFDRGEE